MQTATLPNHHRFTGAYKPLVRSIQTLGICPCGCHETVSDAYVYVRWEDEVFVDSGHLFKHIGAVEIG